VIDKCNPHTAGYGTPTMIPSVIADDSYTIATTVPPTVVLPFTTSPSYCADRLSYSFIAADDSSPSIIGSQGSAVSFTEATRELQYYYSGSNDLAGTTPSGIDYTLTVHATLDATPGLLSGSTSYVLTIKNPCLDNTLV